jgi:hypothetical protein
VARDWLAWHQPYDEDGSSLQQRLAAVQRHLRAILDERPPGPIRVISLCAGQGRDLLGVLAEHPRRSEVSARLVELDPRNVVLARQAVTALDLPGIEVVEGDAALTDAYAGAVPADVVLACGVFGNVTDDDIERTVAHLPSLCATAATVVWTRYPRDAELLPQIDRWFREAGFEQRALEVGADGRRFGVGVHRLAAPPLPFEPGRRLFTFLDDPDPAGTRSPR